MPYVVLTIWFPPHKGREVGLKALEVIKKVSGDKYVGKNILSGALMRTKDGIKGITIAEIKEGQLEAAIAQATDMLEMYSEVEGLNGQIDIMASMGEALSSVGLKVPE
ncbi:MAG: hypothetical protein ACFFHV_18880 [Promethearchaeota archaeon]